MACRHGRAANLLLWTRKRGENVRKYLTEEKKIAPERIDLAQGPGERDVVTIQLLPPAQSP